jgi:hypothetical protein
LNQRRATFQNTRENPNIPKRGENTIVPVAPAKGEEDSNITNGAETDTKSSPGDGKRERASGGMVHGNLDSALGADPLSEDESSEQQDKIPVLPNNNVLTTKTHMSCKPRMRTWKMKTTQRLNQN